MGWTAFAGRALGGAAVLAAAERIAEVSAVVTIGAPSDPAHIAHLLVGTAAEIQARGHADVCIGRRTFRVGRECLHDIGEQPQAERIARLRAALLILHSPQDTVVGVDNARRIYQAARHPKSFISLDGADHLLADPADAGYVAEVIAAWAGRYLPRDAATILHPALAGPAPVGPVRDDSVPDGAVDVAWAGGGRYRQAVRTSTHDWVVDEPVSVGGNDAGPNPYDQLLAALGACTSITLRMYADRKGYPLQHVSVRLRHDRIHAKDCADCAASTGTLTRIRRDIRLDGPLTAEQRQALMSVADRCPVHQVLRSETVIETHVTDLPCRHTHHDSSSKTGGAAGVAGGLIGGVVLGGLMQMMDIMPMITMLVGSDSFVMGWIVHLAISVFIGIT